MDIVTTNGITYESPVRDNPIIPSVVNYFSTDQSMPEDARLSSFIIGTVSTRFAK